MKKANSRLGLLGSLAIHSVVFGSVWGVMQAPKPERLEEVSSISVELLAARLEQEQVAVAVEESLEKETTQSEPEIVAEPVISEPIPIPKPVEKAQKKPKEKLKEKEKPKEKSKELAKKEPRKEPKKEKEKPIKALERGKEAKEGIVAKAIPNAHQGTKAQAGIPNGAKNGNPVGTSATGSPNGTPNSKGTGSANSSSSGHEVNAYKALLQRTLQQRANNAYPQREKMMRKMGIVTLRFGISSSGQVTGLSIAKSSGNSNLDAAAMKAAQSTKLNSGPPIGFPSSLEVPVRFSVQ